MGTIELKETLSKVQIEGLDGAYFEQGKITHCKFIAAKKKVVLELQLPRTLPLEQLQCFNDGLIQLIGCPVELRISADVCDLDSGEMLKYCKYFSEHSRYGQGLRDAIPTVKDQVVDCLFTDETLKQQALACREELDHFMQNAGVSYDFEFSCRAASFTQIEVKMPKEAPKPQAKPAYSADKPSYRSRRTKMEDYTVLALKEINDEIQNVQFTGTIFEKDSITIKKTGNEIQTLYVKDNDDAITCKRFESARCPKEKLNEVGVGDDVRVYGSVRYDSFSKELVFFPDDIVKLEKKEEEQDTADVKRVELHCHTNKSEMDGVCEVEELVTQAFKWGHRAIAVTDHMACQAFPKAQSCAAKLLKGNKDREFKILYGVEMNMVDEFLTIIRNPRADSLSDTAYVVYDLETTGLSCSFDHIIEFGAVVIERGEIKETKQLFVKPPVPINAFISEKTNITNEDVAQAKPFAEVAQELVDFIGDKVLVAHNATFDYNFLNEELKRIGMAPLTNPVVDTLDLARALHSDRRSYRLGNIARHYRITYDEEVAHRADYDADVLASVFMLMIKECKDRGAQTVADLQNLQDKKAFVKVMKRHVNVIAKNQAGLKDLFKLVTLSNTDYLAVFGKANSKSSGEEFLAEPRILRRCIQELRGNLLIGSACYNGEVFELAANHNQQDLEAAIAFYDYIEIQPLENYRPLVESHSLPDTDRLKQVLMRIIRTAKKLNKPVVATGDVHYCKKEEKILRDIYIQTQGIGGVRHPLYIYDKERRSRTVTPDQHFLTTNQMLQAFDWVEDRQLAYELVVEAPNAIADQVEKVLPVHDKLYTPVIEGSEEKLKTICYENAHKTYGEVLPEIVEKRLERELNSIIGNGFAVIYYISHLLVKKSNEDGYLVGSRGSVGSSFVATMSGITEVNPLIPHYVCPDCQHSEFITDGSVKSGFNLPAKKCPKCGAEMIVNGHDIAFETFLGFEGDKVPDIDLNFSGEYQDKAHAFTKTVFGEDHVFRAGTIGTVAQKTAFGYVSGYAEEMGLENMRQAQRLRLANGCEGVKRTTGQHPGGIIVIPSSMDVYDFTPVQYPANNPDSEWKTTHFDFHDIHDNVLKFDILGHVDPTAMRLLQNISGIDPTTIPMNDPETMSIFNSVDALKADPRVYGEATGAVGLPEFGTKFVRGILELTRPSTFSELLRISGLSHGTDVWLNNAKDLIDGGLTLHDVIGCRDDIMTYLIEKGMPKKDSFFIMESVRKGKGLKPEWIELMKENNIPQWYIDSCLKIKYLFPKAHAVAYVMMAIRIAWFKVHHPYWYYVAFFTLRCDAYEIETMVKGMDAIKRRMDEIQAMKSNPETKRQVTKKDEDLYSMFEACLEMYARGYRFSNIDIDKSLATEFRVLPDDLKTIIPPFTTVDGLGANVAKSIVEAREQGEFLSKEDLLNRTQLSQTLMRKLEVLGTLAGMQEENQLSLF